MRAAAVRSHDDREPARKGTPIPGSTLSSLRGSVLANWVWWPSFQNHTVQIERVSQRTCDQPQKRSSLMQRNPAHVQVKVGQAEMSGYNSFLLETLNFQRYGVFETIEAQNAHEVQRR
jgi:hypothetical protein